MENANDDAVKSKSAEVSEEAGRGLIAPADSVLALVSDWRKKANILSEQLRCEPHGNYKWQLQGRAHALRDAAMELEKALNDQRQLK